MARPSGVFVTQAGSLGPRGGLSGELSEQNLTGARFFHATLTGASLQNANLMEVFGLGDAHYDSATSHNQWTQFSDDFDTSAAGLTLVTSRTGDSDTGGVLDEKDVNWLKAKTPNGYWVFVPDWLPSSLFDLNGDADLDGEFNTGDLVQVLEAGKYEKG